jgi:hypothetical protein
MCFDTGSVLPGAFDDPPMPDALNLVRQAEFNGFAPEERCISRISCPIRAPNCRRRKTMIEPETSQRSCLLADARGQFMDMPDTVETIEEMAHRFSEEG